MAIDLKTYEDVKIASVDKKSAASKIEEFLKKDIQLFSSGISDKTKEQFYSHLHMLLSAGVGIKYALTLFEQSRKKKLEKQIFSSLCQSIINGTSLSGAMLKEKKYFSEYEQFGVMIGEESGLINDVLREQANFFARKIKLKRQFTSVLAYPSVVFAVAIGVVFFMMKIMVPMFSDTFKRFGGELPYLTKIVIRVSNWFADYGTFSILILIGLITFIVSQSKKEWFRKIGSAIILKIPVLNKLIIKIYLTRFCQAMNLLLTSKTRIDKAIALAKNMVGFYPLEKSLEAVREDILRGTPLNKALSKFPIYDLSMLALIKAAEEVNRLDVIFGRLAKLYSEDVEQQSDIFGKLMEPLMIVFIGLFVALILFAMYLPMFMMSTSIH